MDSTRGGRVIGWELDCPTLDALGEAANIGEPARCRVRACREPLPHGDHCAEHDTPEVRAMARPHVYVYQGRRIVLEASPWDAAPARSPAPATVPVPPAPRPPAPAPRARPCWSWCGRGARDPGCIHHPASVYATPPSVPCLACGRETFSCRNRGACCSERCSEFWRDLRFLAPAETAARWLTPDEIVSWEERAAIMQEDPRIGSVAAGRRAMVTVWRRLRASHHAAAQSAAPVPSLQANVVLVQPVARQLQLL